MAQIVEKSDLKEGLTAKGLYYIDENGEQGLVPRAKKEDNFNLTDDQIVLKEKWIKEIKRDYPNLDESTIDFICCFYLKDPKEYEELVNKNKDKPSRYEDSIFELQKKYGNSVQQEQAEQFNNLISNWNIQSNNEGLELFDYKFEDISNN